MRVVKFSKKKLLIDNNAANAYNIDTSSEGGGIGRRARFRF